MTASDVAQKQARRPVVKRAKYGATPTTVDGIRFHSAKEARRYAELKLMEKAGEIRGLQLQPKYLLTTESLDDGEPRELGSYVGDFFYEERVVRGVIPARPDNVAISSVEWEDVLEDVKGFKTPLYRWKKKHVEAQYGIVIQEI